MADTDQNISFFLGDTVSIFLTLRGSSGTALDLTGCTLRWGLAPVGSTTPSLTKSSSSALEISVTSTSGGLATVFLTAANTASLSAGAYTHEVELTDASGSKETLTQGRVTVNATILN